MTPKLLDDILNESTYPIPVTLQYISLLEVKGIIKQIVKKRRKSFGNLQYGLYGDFRQQLE